MSKPRTAHRSARDGQFVSEDEASRNADTTTRETFDRRADAVIDAAITLVARLREVHEDPAYVGVWMLHHAHGGRYDGPTYTAELAALTAALDAMEEGE